MLALSLSHQHFLLSRETSTSLDQVASERLGAQERLGPPPTSDTPMVPREQHLGNAPAAKDRRPRVLGVLEEPVVEALLARGLLVTEHSRYQSGHRLHHRGACPPPAVHDDVPNREFPIDEVIVDPLVHTPVPATQKREAL